MISLFWHDYVVFAILTLIYTIIGVYFSYPVRIKRFYRKLFKIANYQEDAPETTDDLFFGGRKMTIIPIVGTMAATFLSSISILANNAEVYSNGIEYIYMGLSYFFAYPLVAEIYAPVYYNLQISSSNEYLEMRFSKIVRLLTMVIYLLQMTIYSAVVLFAPSLAVSYISGVSINVAIIITGVIATFYTALGGIRAVIWTDLIQVFVILSSLMLIIILGTINVGGIKNLYQISLNGGRINLKNFNPDPFIRQSFWSLFFGGFGLVLITYATNQVQIQRYLSCKSIKTAKIAIYLNLPISIILIIIQVYGGIVAYAKYHKCDPKIANKMKRSDQILPYLVMNLFENIPLVRGLFLSCMFAATLSTLSSTINTISFVIVEDLMKQVIMKICKKFTFKQSTLVIISRILAIFIGILIIVLAFLLSMSDTRLLIITFNLFGAIGGPIFTVFTLGILFPFVNHWGALSGLIASLSAGIWILIGSTLYRTIKPSSLPLGQNCSISTTTKSTTTSVISATVKHFNVYNLSFYYFAMLCFIVGVIVATIISLLTGMNSKRPISQSLIAAQMINICKYLPNWILPQTTPTPVKSRLVIQFETECIDRSYNSKSELNYHDISTRL